MYWTVPLDIIYIFKYNKTKRPAKGLFKKLKIGCEPWATSQSNHMNIFSKISNYIRESIAELKKVTWPTRKQTVNYTLLIIGISLGLALFIGIVDYILTMGFQQVIK